MTLSVCHELNSRSITGKAGAVSKGHPIYAKPQNGHIKRTSYLKIYNIS
jgi:hypothetical protein